MVGRYLVTTALEETWPEENIPVLFLGEWCRLYDRKAVWEARDAVVAPYHWDNREKLHQDYEYIQSLYEELLVELVEKLNTLHDVKHSVRYWRIIVGPWLGYFVQVLYDRWAMLQQVVCDYHITGVRVIWRGANSLVPNDMSEFVSFFVEDAWNEMIYGQLLELMDIPIEYVNAKDDSIKDTISASVFSIPNFYHRIIKVLVKFVSNRSFLKNKDDYFFICTYLPLKLELFLQLKLRQIPKLWRSFPIPIVSVNSDFRKLNCPILDDASVFFKIVRSKVLMHIPVVYLEGYKCILDLTRKLPWPKQPKVIFTSNSQNSDEVFKIWTSEKVDAGTQLVIGQHGGNYGMASWNFLENHEIAISDRYLTWGWSHEDYSKIKPVGILKGFSGKYYFDKKGFALLVEMVLPRFSYWMYSTPVSSQVNRYLQDQYRFIQALPIRLRKQVLVRLFTEDYGWSQKKRWVDLFSELQIDDGIKPMSSLVSNSRLYISTYNATTYLESMSSNIPTIMFWNPNHWELRDSAIPFFEKLKSVGIFHETPESAAKQMTDIWDDVSGWWESTAVQTVRREFCERYAHNPEKPLNGMAKLFREIIADHN